MGCGLHPGRTPVNGTSLNMSCFQRLCRLFMIIHMLFALQCTIDWPLPSRENRGCRLLPTYSHPPRLRTPQRGLDRRSLRQFRKLYNSSQKNLHTCDLTQQKKNTCKKSGPTDWNAPTTSNPASQQFSTPCFFQNSGYLWVAIFWLGGTDLVESTHKNKETSSLRNMCQSSEILAYWPW